MTDEPADGGAALPPQTPPEPEAGAPSDPAVADGGESRGSPIGRRVVLGMIGLGVAGILVGKRVQSVISDAMAPIQAADPTGITQLLPAAGGFRFYTITDSFPAKSDADYRLHVTGLVEKPLTLTLDDLKAMTPVSLVRDFQCVTGWRVSSVHWTGVLLSEILDAAGVKPGGQRPQLSQLRRGRHREPHHGPGPPARRDRRL